jgi:hypothetical protein
MGYKELHAEAERWIAAQLRRKGHRVEIERAVNHEVLFDVYDRSTKTAYEVLTAKFFRSGHEQDEMILYKFFHYLMVCPRLKVYVVSYERGQELEMLHNLGLQHWHLWSGGWFDTEIRGSSYHRGSSVARVVDRIYKAMLSFAPLREWTREGRRAKHPKKDVEVEFTKITKQLGLPKNFLIGLWRDWRLLWVWRLEYILPLWQRRAELMRKGTVLKLLAKIPKKEKT